MNKYRIIELENYSTKTEDERNSELTERLEGFSVISVSYHYSDKLIILVREEATQGIRVLTD